LRVSRLAHGGRLEVTPRSDRRGTAYGRDLDVLQIGGDPCCTCLLNLCWASRATFKALVSQSSICVAFTQAASHASSSRFGSDHYAAIWEGLMASACICVHGQSQLRDVLPQATRCKCFAYAQLPQ
jgi:hypothetical protein